MYAFVRFRFCKIGLKPFNFSVSFDLNFIILVKKSDFCTAF